MKVELILEFQQTFNLLQMKIECDRYPTHTYHTITSGIKPSCFLKKFKFYLNHVIIIENNMFPVASLKPKNITTP
jgi:hypothetical protein